MIFTKQFQIGAGETDLFGRCRPSSIAYFLQDVATIHAENLGASREDMLETGGVVWVMSKLCYWLEKDIQFKDILEISTWHRGKIGAVYYRDFRICRDGQQIGQATSCWILYNMKTGKILREEPENLAQTKYIPENPITLTLNKMTSPENLDPSYHKRINYSDLDVNNHMNNIKYFDVATDCINLEYSKNKWVKSIQVNYLGQCLAGEILQMYTNADNDFYICGESAGKKRFEAKIILSS